MPKVSILICSIKLVETVQMGKALTTQTGICLPYSKSCSLPGLRMNRTEKILERQPDYYISPFPDCAN